MSARSSPAPTIHVVVADSERKTLAEYIKRKLAELPDTSLTFRSAIVDNDAQAVLSYARTVKCEKLFMLFHPDESDFQQQLFIESMYPTMWLRSGPEPNSTGQLICVFKDREQLTDLAAEQMFGQSSTNSLILDSDDESNDAPAAVMTAANAQSIEPGDLLLCGVQGPTKSDPHYATSIALLKQTTPPAVALVHSGDTLIESFAGKLRSWSESIVPLMSREHRVDLSNDLQIGSQPNLEYLGLISASSMLAAFGLLQNSAAVIIGAMLIAPLMTPIMGAGLALTQGNRPLFKKSMLTICLGFTGALTASILFGWLYWLIYDPFITSEMWARCRPSPLDFCVGLVGGLAASYARTRTHLSSALAGAAIAAALVPPISTAGLQIAFGEFERSNQGTPVIGPLLLVTINVLTIMVGSSFVLWARGMRIDRSLYLADRWVLRVFALLATLVLLILTWVVVPH
ncbi:MAG: DUF389 domain-containing protein [Rubripirellula sp.]